MKKTLIFVVFMCLLFTAMCAIVNNLNNSKTENPVRANNETNVSKPDIMEMPRSVMHGNIHQVSIDQFRRECMENTYGFVIKITATNSYENILLYEMRPDNNGTLKDYKGYENLPRENGVVVAEAVNPAASHMLTDVIIDEIYYTGENIDFKIGDTIAIVEDCFIHPGSNWWLIMENEEEDTLFILDGAPKFEPGKEYLFFGYKDMREGHPTNGKYRTVGVYEGKIELEADFTENKPINYFDSSNGERVIEDYIESYRKEMQEAGFAEYMWR